MCIRDRLKGVEANVRGTDGSLDIEPQEFERMQLDWVIASIHSDTLCPSPVSYTHLDVYKRQAFNRQKLLNGMMRACEKRPVSYQMLEDLSLIHI